MDSKSQAAIEYLFAIVLSFLLTLVVLSSLVGFTGNTKESIVCKIEKCGDIQANPETKNQPSANALLFTVTLVVFYFVEFFFVFLFLKYVCRPEKKKLQKKSRY